MDLTLPEPRKIRRRKTSEADDQDKSNENSKTGSQLNTELKYDEGEIELIQQKMPIMCIGEYTDVNRWGRSRAQVVMTPFLYYPEVDCFYIDLPDEWETWEDEMKKEYFISQLNENEQYLDWSENKATSNQLGTLVKQCHQGKLLKHLVAQFDVDHEKAHNLIVQIMDKLSADNWNEKSLVVPSKSIFVDVDLEGNLKMILYQMTLDTYVKMRELDDFLQHRINILQDSLIENQLEQIMAILLGSIMEWPIKGDRQFLDVAYDIDLLEEDPSLGGECDENLCIECRLRREREAREATSNADEPTDQPTDLPSE